MSTHQATRTVTLHLSPPGRKPPASPVKFETPDPWEDLIVNRYGYLKPQRHSRLERRRAARKAAIREMDARLSGPGAA